MRDGRSRDTRMRSRSPPQPRGPLPSPVGSHRGHRNISPQIHRHHGVEEPTSMLSQYPPGHYRIERQLSPPIRRRRRYSPSPLARYHLVDRSPHRYHITDKELMHSQPLTDAHYAPSSLGLSPDSWRKGLSGKEFEKRRYEEHKYTDRYSNHSSHMETGLDDGNSVRNRKFSGYVGPGACDKYGYWDANNSVVGLRLGGDGTWNYDKLTAGEPSREEERLKFNHEDDLPNVEFTGKIHAPTYLYVPTGSFSGYLKGTGNDKHRQMIPVRSGYEDILDSSPVIRSQMEKAGCVFAYSREQKNNAGDFGSLPDKLYYENLASVREKYGLQGTFRSSPEVRLADGIETVEDSGGERIRGRRLLDHQHYSTGISYRHVLEEGYEARTTHLEEGREEYLEYEPSQNLGDNGSGECHGYWPYGNNFNSISLPDHKEGVQDADWNSQHRFTEEELGSASPYKRTVKPKHGFDKRRLGYNFATSHLSHGDEKWITEGANYSHNFVKHGKVISSYNSHSNERFAIPEDFLFSDDKSKGRKRSHRNPMVPSGRDVRMRLGPSTSYNRKPYPWVMKTFLDGTNWIDHASVGSGGESLVTVTERFESKSNTLVAVKAEPPEDSEEFTQLVNGAFLKFVKLLNENMAQRRKYTDQGRSGILKCGVCGRNSKMFMDALGLAMHSHTTRARFRAEHLGLHRALCILLGWNHAVGPTGTWGKQELPAADALALREDLIIWPPVVIIQNSSIANSAPGERVILSVAEMQAILREMGFGGDKTKVTRGKPGNQSILVASFHGTFTGLFDAESLHQRFIEKGQGRVEFGNKNSIKKMIQGTDKAPENKLSDVYGYLGIAEDLDKLDFEMKKRCVVKSRKEIQVVASFKCKGP